MYNSSVPPAPVFRFDPNSPIPAVRQIADNLRTLFVERKLAPGAALPSVRRVATELGVHFNTVAEAYRQLAAEGWLDLKHGRGAIVIERATPKVPETAHLEQMRAQMRSLVSQMRADGFAKATITAELRSLIGLLEDS